MEGITVPEQSPAMVCTIVYVADSADQASDPGTVTVSADQDAVLGPAFADLGIPWEVLTVQAVGDRGRKLVPPPDISALTVADLLPNRLASVLRGQAPDGTPPIKLRLLLQVEESAGGAEAGNDVAFRVLRAADSQLASSQSASPLTVFVSDDFYRKVIVAGSGIERGAYRSIPLTIDGGSSQVWMRQDEPADDLLSWLDELPAEDPGMLKLLRILAFMGGKVSLELLSGVDSSGDGALERLDTLGNAGGFVRIDRSANTVSVHRLPLLVLRDRMSADERSNARQVVHQLLARVDPGEPALPESWPTYQELAPHAQASGLVESPDERCRALVVKLMRYLYLHGEQQRALDLAREAWTVWGSDNERDPQSLDLANNLGLFLWALNRFEEAAEINRRTLELRREVSGDDAPETIRARLRVALDVRTRGDFVAAREENQAIHQRAAQLFGERDPLTLQTAHDLAVSTRLCGEYEAARSLDDTTSALRADVLGEHASDTLLSRSGLFVDLLELGDYEGALDGSRQVAGQLLELTGAQAPGTLVRQGYLAVALRRAGDLAGARELSGDTLVRLTAVYGTTHHLCTLACAVGHATDLRNQGDVDDAYRVGEQARSDYREVLGANHPHTLAAAANAAVTLRLRGDSAAARELNERALKGFTESPLGADHPQAIACAVNFASDLAELGDREAAVRVGTEAARRAGDALGADHPMTLAAELNLTLDEAALGRDVEARYTEISDRYRATLGAEHPATAGARARARANCDIDPLPM
jgi:tetratricopeptide (TPR) repeat protein